MGAASEEKSSGEEEEEEEEEEEDEGSLHDHHDAVENVDAEKKEDGAGQEPASAGMMPSRLQTQRPAVAIHIVPPPAPSLAAVRPLQTPPPPPPPPPLTSLSSKNYTNKISLAAFLLHLLVFAALVTFLSYKAVQGVLEKGTRTARRERRAIHYWLPPIEGAAVLGVLLAFAWQKSVRSWPSFMVLFIPWASFAATMAAGVLLLCFSLPATDGVGVSLILFSIGTALYACWSSRRAAFTARVFSRSMAAAAKFPGLNRPAYLMMFVGFLWTSMWCFAVIGAALNSYLPAMTVMYLVVSLAWTAEVMRNVANLTVSRVVALYYLRGMQCSTRFSFQRAVSVNLGSACLGSLLVPTIEGLRIVARGLNLLEGEDEFMFSCAHCCLSVMEWVFHYGNSWAYVHIAAYGRGFVAASRSTWEMFQREEGLEELVDSDITSSVCFLTGVASGALCVIFAASLSFSMRRQYTATVSILAFWVGYLMTRIGMALPQACVGCYYVCYAENPSSRLFDSNVPDRLAQIRSGRDPYVPTPRFPRRFPSAATAAAP